jgi:LDH2 family malate/lactate/ureidoglycolate dehydrogenase
MSQALIDQEQKGALLGENRYNPEMVRELVGAIAKATGVNSADAAVFADALVGADLYGTSTHGVSRLAIYIRRIQKGLIDPIAKLRIDRQNGSTLVIDAGNGLGQVQATKSLEMLMPMAEGNGIAACTIHNSQHFGALSYYCNIAAENDMILFATTNCEPSMAPYGAREAYFGTNPLACSFPTTKEYPVKIDLATSLVARGNVITAQKRGEAIPLGWALTEDGKQTTDPEAALAGTMLPMAGHKGYALALMIEILSGVLSGSAIGPSIGSMYNNMSRAQDVGHFFCLVDISAFMDASKFKRRLDSMIDEIKSCRKREDVEEIFIPGERSHRKAEENRKQGIFIEESTRRELKLLCEELGIEFRLNW